MIDHSSNIFGIPFFQFTVDDIAEHQQAFVDMANELKQQDQGVNRSNQGGWHSVDNLHQHDHPEAQWLMKQVFQSCSSIIKKMKTGLGLNRIQLVSSWININQAGNWNAPHMHMPAQWSGVVYIKVKEAEVRKESNVQDGDILFLNPSAYGPLYGSKPFKAFSPKDGELFLFPSHLMHMVAPHFEESDRVSVAFNFKLSK